MVGTEEISRLADIMREKGILELSIDDASESIEIKLALHVIVAEQQRKAQEEIEKLSPEDREKRWKAEKEAAEKHRAEITYWSSAKR